MDKLDKAKYLNRVIIASWIGLAVCFVIKIFGASLFEIACANENFIAVCNYADTHYWANYLINCLHCFISLYFFTLAILGEYKFKRWQLIVVIITVFVGTYIKLYNSKIGLFFDIWQFVLMPLLFIGKEFKRMLLIPIANILLFSFQAISMLSKNLGFKIVTEYGLLIGIIYSIDITIMLLLYYLYSNQIKQKRRK